MLFSVERGTGLCVVQCAGVVLHTVMYNGLCLHQDILRGQSEGEKRHPKTTPSTCAGRRHQFFKSWRSKFFQFHFPQPATYPH